MNAHPIYAAECENHGLYVLFNLSSFPLYGDVVNTALKGDYTLRYVNPGINYTLAVCKRSVPKVFLMSSLRDIYCKKL